MVLAYERKTRKKQIGIVRLKFKSENIDKLTVYWKLQQILTKYFLCVIFIYSTSECNI